MTSFKLLLVALAACSVLFISWLLLGSYFWVQNKSGMAVICFLLAFISVLGQFATLALTLRQHQRLRQSKPATRRPSL
ncbi:hypothetical protein PT286_06750 [Neisseriaceae bacterium ESL0693]|nr:hypothetical protein [Neisseriaceae bacterium ESL0693]